MANLTAPIHFHFRYIGTLSEKTILCANFVSLRSGVQHLKELVCYSRRVNKSYQDVTLSLFEQMVGKGGLVGCIAFNGRLRQYFSLYRAGWSGGAMVLGQRPVPGRPTVWIAVGQGPTALVVHVGAGGGCLEIFTLVYPFLSCFSLSLGDDSI